MNVPLKTIEVGIEPDALEKITRVSVDLALEELIWNAIDAEASKIDVAFTRNEIDGITEIIVSDDGHGIAVDDTEAIFGSIGGSSKRLRRRSPKLDRPYHGKEGQGRYKAFSLGGQIEWKSRTLRNGSVQAFSVILEKGQLKSARIGQPVSVDGQTGCEVVIRQVHNAVSGLDNQSRLSSLTHRLAPFLMANSGIRIKYDGESLDIGNAVTRNELLEIKDKGTGDEAPLDFKLRILEWNKARKGSLFWCDEHGVALDETPLEMKGVRFPFTAYILSDEIRSLSDGGGLALGDLSPTVRRFKDLARGNLKNYFRTRQAEEAQHVADRIRGEGIYPYSHVPKNPVEKVEQQVFDICAATVHEFLPQFDNADKNSRQFTYRLLKEALENNPSNLNLIFKEVLKLSEEQQEHLAQLLKKTSLGAIITAANTVSDRLAFINGLEQILHKKTIRTRLKERTQLHRILVEELWLFGDQYTLGGDDVSLKTVLDTHRDVLGLAPLDKQTKQGITELADVPDLLLWQQYLRRGKEEFEHFVIELKRPLVNVSQTEIGQVKRYASKVVNNKYFDKNKTSWKFVVLSDGIAEDAKADVHQHNREPGLVTSSPDYEIWALTWAQVIQAAKVRLAWIQDKLELTVSDNSEGMEYLREKFGHLLPEEALENSDIK
ncbi:ATP-binding protein [Novipirellula caenicola]|uniref:DNA mismatch repair protein n=1 Tax=Novipirellula caenicola TaxID=1536901 RepID=A0ABP9VWK6_9BACT